MAERGGAGEQLALVREQVRRSRPREPDPPAAQRPVARVLVDVSLAHLDRPFDYLVPASMDERVTPGVRVRVRFAGQLVDGFVLDRVDASGHPGRLARLSRVTSSEPVLTPQVAALARQVSDRYAGTLADVLRLAVPPRHATVEAEPSPGPPLPPDAPPSSRWADYPAGPAYLHALQRAESPRAVWSALPGRDWAPSIAAVVAATLSAGRGALVVLPDARDVGRLDDALRGLVGAAHHAVLTADLGPAERYRRWLAVRRGAVRAVLGTRAAAFAPVSDLGLVALWDDGDDLHAEPRAPYPHAREVLLLRARAETAAVLIGGYARTAETAQLLARGWAAPLEAPRTAVRWASPRVRVAGDDADLARDVAARTARLPSLAWRTARDALRRGPVLVQVPRAGYVPALRCGECRAPARCPACHGPLALASGHAVAGCGWCGRPAGDWACPHCASTAFRAQAVGARRTAEELGRAFPGVPLRTSGRDHVLDRVGAGPALVVATPGAEPPAEGGYAAALLLDGWVLLSRSTLRAGEEALRRWLAAAALVRPAGDGGDVVLMADATQPPVQALVRWDPGGHAERELSDRTAAALPPVTPLAELSGVSADVADLLALLRLPAGAGVMGPLPLSGEDDRVRAIVRAAHPAAAALAQALREAQAVRSAAKRGGHVRIRVDPVDLA